MRVLAQRDAVLRIVVPRLGKLMYMRCVDDRRATDRRDTVASQSARVIVGRHNIQSEPDVAATLVRRFRFLDHRNLGR